MHTTERTASKHGGFKTRSEAHRDVIIKQFTQSESPGVYSYRIGNNMRTSLNEREVVMGHLM